MFRLERCFSRNNSTSSDRCPALAGSHLSWIATTTEALPTISRTWPEVSLEVWEAGWETCSADFSATGVRQASCESADQENEAGSECLTGSGILTLRISPVSRSRLPTVSRVCPL